MFYSIEGIRAAGLEFGWTPALNRIRIAAESGDVLGARLEWGEYFDALSARHGGDSVVAARLERARAALRALRIDAAQANADRASRAIALGTLESRLTDSGVAPSTVAQIRAALDAAMQDRRDT